MRIFGLISVIIVTLFSLNVKANDELATGALQIQHAQARASIPGQFNSAAYFLVKNEGLQTHALVSVSSPAAKMVQIHRSFIENGMAKMQQIEELSVKPNEQQELKPGGLHVMLMGLVNPLLEGELLPLKLTFEDGSEMFMELPIKHIG